MKIRLRWMQGVVVLTGALAMAGPAQAASFDCAKAKTRVEKLICQNPKLSALDEQLAKQYVEGLKQTKDPVALKRRQRVWLRELRKYCTTEMCLEGAYIARIRAIENGDGAKVYDTPALLDEHESDKAAKFKSLLTQHPMLLDKKVTKTIHRGFCKQFYTALGMADPAVHYVEPMLRTNDPANPALGKYIACTSHEPVDPELHFDMIAFATTKFRLYRFTPAGQSNGKVDEFLYGEHPGNFNNVFSASLVNVDFKTCNRTLIPATPESQWPGSNKIYGTNALLDYRNRHYFVDLARFGKTGSYLNMNLYLFDAKRQMFTTAPLCSWNISHD